MPQWTKKILRGKKGEIGTVTVAPEGSDVKATKLLEFIEVSDPKVAEAGFCMTPKKMKVYFIGLRAKYCKE